THRGITQKAILRKTAEVCRDIAATEGRDFIDDNLSVTRVQRACSSTSKSASPISADMFQTAINSMSKSNADVDRSLPLEAEYHFDNEAFQGGRTIIDFYSHSNWVELGKTTPYSTLIRPDEPLENLASGYFDIFSSVKPAKCSHGGQADKTSTVDPVGGINKDGVESGHGSFHVRAANLAVDATMELLEDIRVAAGDRNFLLMALSQAPALCFVIDTTGSMRDDIESAKAVSFNIIDIRRETQQEPSEYILVPFNDPFGPVIRTTDADAFKVSINSLTANGGGDNPEMSLSGLQLALTAAPPSSDIFVFTDAPAKVNFMLTDVLSRRRRDSQGLASRVLNVGQTQLYRDLAQTSGGQAIEVPKSGLPLATAVTVFQAVINPGRPESLAFTVDALINNIIIYVTGAPSLTFTLTSSTLSQTSSQFNGPLANFTTVGNLRRIILITGNRTGLWNISINSNTAYTVKVTNNDFLVRFIAVPAGEFAVRLTGQDTSSTSRSTSNTFQRQASTQIKTSSLSVTAQADIIIEPGSTASIPFTVSSDTNGTFTVRVNNDRSYNTTSPSSVAIGTSSGGKANGTVTLTPPASTVSGTDVTLTIEVQNAATTEINYAVLRFSVSARVTDLSGPVCQETNVSGDCSSSSSPCAISFWNFSAVFTDGINGTGIASITLRQGNGTLDTRTGTGAGGENITVVTYNSSCCSPNVELAAVDRVGNVG
uniref:von Willebrand factor A domain containing 10, tandem duplicate 1 n=1 Tax=Amphiprion percula TaxID=161767 RepID=A0A3P8S1Z2_AMPPE